MVIFKIGMHPLWCLGFAVHLLKNPLPDTQNAQRCYFLAHSSPFIFLYSPIQLSYPPRCRGKAYRLLTLIDQVGTVIETSGFPS